ncbi:MAG: hypothetical protein C4583_02565 [Anaerolineaceae bacterium]|nr:MAG: hypothetical protein C4583_02565 [Anaerolineaceae bacterium]
MKRPFAVTTLLFLVLCLTVWNAIRLYAAIADWDALTEFAPRPGPLYISITASFWTLSGVVLWMALRRRNPRSRSYFAIYVLGYTLWWWADRLLLQITSPNWPFAAGLTVFLLGVITLDLFNKKATSYFRQRETHEQTPTDSNPA